MNNTLSQIFDDFVTKTNAQTFFNPSRTPSFERPKVNIFETEDAFLLECSIPGISKEDIKVEVEDKTLTISYLQKDEPEKEEQPIAKVIRREFAPQNFRRSFRLGDTLDTEKIEARFELGILHLVISKKEEMKPSKRIVEIA